MIQETNEANQNIKETFIISGVEYMYLLQYLTKAERIFTEIFENNFE